MHNRAPHTYGKSPYLLCVPRGDVFMEVLMKNPLTHEEQLTALKSKGLIIEDDNKCLEFLCPAIAIQQKICYNGAEGALKGRKSADTVCTIGQMEG